MHTTFKKHRHLCTGDGGIRAVVEWIHVTTAGNPCLIKTLDKVPRPVGVGYICENNRCSTGIYLDTVHPPTSTVVSLIQSHPPAKGHRLTGQSSQVHSCTNITMTGSHKCRTA